MAMKRVNALRKQALTRLTEYRDMSFAQRRGTVCDTQTDAWIGVIERCYVLLKSEDPLKARYMSRLFGMEHPVPRRKCAHERIAQLSRELCCSEATLYNWRDEIVCLVLYGAIEIGLIGLYGVGNCGRGDKNAI